MLLNGIVRRLAAATAVAVLCYVSMDGSLFSYHPILNSLAFLICLGEAVAAMRGKRSENQVKLHSALNWIGTLHTAL